MQNWQRIREISLYKHTTLWMISLSCEFTDRMFKLHNSHVHIRPENCHWCSKGIRGNSCVLRLHNAGCSGCTRNYHHCIPCPRQVALMCLKPLQSWSVAVFISFLTEHTKGEAAVIFAVPPRCCSALKKPFEMHSNSSSVLMETVRRAGKSPEHCGRKESGDNEKLTKGKTNKLEHKEWQSKDRKQDWLIDQRQEREMEESGTIWNEDKNKLFGGEIK